jgi:tetratricopeptide (TPR) repeat protein
VASYDIAIEVEPKFAEAFFNRGLAHEALNQADQALVDYERALIFDPNHSESQRHLALLKQKQV